MDETELQEEQERIARMKDVAKSAGWDAEGPLPGALPCPFCGGAPEGAMTGVLWVVCSECEASSGGSSHTVEGALADWNRRAPAAAESDDDGPFCAWAILELMGHRRLAGRVRDVELFGVRMCRLDVPSDPPVTQIYSPSAIYALTPSTEEICRAVARRNRPEPVHRFELPATTVGANDEDDGPPF